MSARCIEPRFGEIAQHDVRPKKRLRGRRSAKQAKGTVKEAAGKVVGDAKLQADGKADKLEGKVQNAVGGIKDALKKKK